MNRRVLDVEKMPTHAFGPRAPMWWALVCLMAIEGTMLVLTVLSLFYVRDRMSPWPPTLGVKPAAWIFTGELILWLVSVPAMIATVHAAKRADVRGMRRGLILATIPAVLAVVCRVLVFETIPFRWDEHAYGSVVWALLILQFIHVLSGVGENLLFLALLFIGPVEHKHRVDVEVTSLLWWFVVAGVILTWAVAFLPALIGEG